MSRNEDGNHKALGACSLPTKSENMGSKNSSSFGKSRTEFQFIDENDDDFSALDLLLSNICSMQGEQLKDVGHVTRPEPFLDRKGNTSTKLDFSVRLNPSMTLSQQSALYNLKNEEMPQKKIEESTRNANDVEELDNAHSFSLKGNSMFDKYPGNAVDESRLIDRQDKCSNYSTKLTREKLNSAGRNNFAEEFNTSYSIPQQKGESFQISTQGKCSKNSFQHALPAKQSQVFPSEKVYKCGKCKRKFMYKSALIIHMHKHDKPNPYTSILSEPNRVASKVFKCGKCQRKFTYKSSFRTHMQKHDKPISYKSNLPVQNPVETKEVFKCGKCQRKLKYKSAFIIHMQKHDKPNPDASILHKPNPLASILHEPNPAASILHEPIPVAPILPESLTVACPLPESNPATSILPEPNPATSILPEPNIVASILHKTNHVASTLPEPKTVASVLPEQNSAASILPEPNPATFNLPKSNPVRKKKRFNFQFFSRKFTNKLSLNMLKQNHDEPKIYKCDQCPKEFLFDSQLRNHYVVHREEKPFECLLCNFASKWKQNLISHFKRCHESQLKINISAQKKRHKRNFPNVGEGCKKVLK